jgi:acetyltransferase
MITMFTVDDAEVHIVQLAELLMDAVDSGASVGFLPPLGVEEAVRYWHAVIGAMREGHRVLLVAMEGGSVQGALQIALETRANGNHRGEATKLFVHRRARRRGLARVLMAEVEAVARRIGRTLLLMDTRKGGAAEKLCGSLGYTRYGEIPAYARSSNGELHTTVFFYRQL